MNIFLSLIFVLFLYIQGFTLTLQDKYEFEAKQPIEVSDIGEHLPHLRDLAKECAIVVEMGLRDMISTIGLLKGLEENPSHYKSYLGIDINYPKKEIFQEVMKYAKTANIKFGFLKDNNLMIDLPPVELLFIDTWHTYRQLTSELEKFSSKVSKYIAMHDTSEPWGDQDEPAYFNEKIEYNLEINKEKKGLWVAVVDFLERHPEWELYKRYVNCHGFTILKRKSHLPQ